MKKLIKTAIIGASGYTGLELVKILARHNYAKIEFITSNTYKDRPLSEFLAGATFQGLCFKATDEITPGDLKLIDAVFLCLPPHMSMQFVKESLSDFKGAIIDIGSDFRLKDPDNYKEWYGRKHLMVELLESFIYGLPELNYKKIKNAKHIANPGCYPTSVILALAPLAIFLAGRSKSVDGSPSGGMENSAKKLSGLMADTGKNNNIKVNTGWTDGKNLPGFTKCGCALSHEGTSLIQISDINIDSKSGVSGAGKKLKNEYLFCSVNENFMAYSPILHRHIGEIEQELENISGKYVKVSFTPHLLPVSRGIFTTIYCKIKLDEVLAGKLNGGPSLDNNNIFSGECKCGGPASEKKVNESYLKENNNSKDKNEKITDLIENLFSWYYKKSTFVRFVGQKIPQLKDVTYTNYCNIGFAFDDRTDTLKIFSVIDNLVKGAAGQAVQNMNIMFGFDEGEGLNG